MRVVKLGESGVNGALLGMGLSHGKSVPIAKNMLLGNRYTPKIKLRYQTGNLDFNRANKLAHLSGGHNEFLKHITVQFLIEAPSYWWAHLDQYRVGTVDLSTSLMHNAMDRDLEQSDFEDFIPNNYLVILANNRLEVINKTLDFEKYINRIPKGFLYTRVITTNYLTLQNIVNQRKNHKLPQWQLFCDSVHSQLDYPEWVFKVEYNG